MKQKILPAVLAVLVILFACVACAACETVKVSGSDCVNLRSAPNGKIQAEIYGDVPAERLETKGKWSRIRIGGDPVSVTGWMMNDYLTPVEEGEWLYIGQDCIPSQGHDPVELLNERRNGALIADVWDGSHEDSFLTVAGIFSDNEWLLAAYTREDGTVNWYFAAADSLARFDGAYIISRAADTVVSLRAEPSAKAKVLESCFGGVYADYLFDYTRKEGWTRICVGGTAGYMMSDFLMEAEFDVPPYRPPLCPLSVQTVPVYAKSSGNDPVIGMTAPLTQYDLFSVLARGKTRYHIRIDTAEAGRYQYGWIDFSALKTDNLVAGSTKGVIVMDTPVFNWDGEECGALREGQEVILRWFYSSFSPEDHTPVLDYFDPDTSRWVWVDAAAMDSAGEGEFIEEWGIGFVPAEAVEIDEHLIIPEPMGNG